MWSDKWPNTLTSVRKLANVVGNWLVADCYFEPEVACPCPRTALTVILMAVSVIVTAGSELLLGNDHVEQHESTSL